MELIFAHFMQVHTQIDNLPVFRNAVVTIGTFDGVHTGHQQIIAQLKEEARAIGGETIIITFHPHPRKVVAHKEVFILNTLDEKIELLREKGIDHLVVVPFDELFASKSAKEYVEHFLFEKFHPHTVIIGYDHRFGHGRQGDYHLLEDFGKQLGFLVKEIPEHVLNNVTVSSTKIREALLNSDVETANNYLGYDYFFEGIVIEGNKLGRTLGYPTANLQIEATEKLIPGNGVYAVIASFDKSTYKAMMNIGVRPTVDGKKRMIEVNLFDFNQDLYVKTLRVYIKKYLRGEVKFNGLEELKNQLGIDKESALKVL
jgi:riboflavin kinase/FMN adenylyltransferase